jgi:asparagine synthase (glutamine-hydrolysing)
MCGICGIINLRNFHVDELPIRRMMDEMKHRGPDDQGIFLEEGAGFGFVRLSIIDLSLAGHQPMFSPDNDNMIIFNGEIYNYLELRNELSGLGHVFISDTDTEVLLAAYLEWGSDCLHRFNGMWAIAVYNRSTKTLFCARDRFGVKPFYYWHDSEQFIFASEIQPILKVLKGKPNPNYQAIYDYMVYNRTDQTEATFFNGISKLQHGHFIRLKQNQKDYSFEKCKWYDLKSNLKSPLKDEEEFRQLFSSSVGLRLRSDVPVGVCLSGGLDSSSIVSILLKDYDKHDLNTFSAVYDSDFHDDESKFIAEYHEQVKNMHYTRPDASSLFNDLQDFVETHGEPVPSTGPYAQFKVMELAGKKVVVTLDGQGADELLAGYHYFFGFYFKGLISEHKFGRFLKETWCYWRNHKSLYGIYSLIYFLFSPRLKDRIRVTQKGYLENEFVKKYSKTNTISHGLYSSKTLNEALIDHFEYKLEHLLKWEDRNSMRFSVEARVPFLDYRLVESLLSLPSHFIIRDGMTKYILRQSMKGIIPEKIRLRHDKVGFDAPQEKWFRNEIFNDYILKILSSNTFESRGIANSIKVKEMFRKHSNGKSDASKEIWKCINLELWFRTFID